jgi:hypothetical protein
MARGEAAKLRRRNRKTDDQANADSIFGEDDIPGPPGLSQANVEDDDSDAAEKVSEEDVLPKKKKKHKSRSADEETQMPPKKASKGFKSTPLILLIIMTGSTLLPALIFASDYLGNIFQKHHVIGEIGFRLGMGSVPRKRVLSFYEKHDPNKLEDVPKILSKHYGDYPILIKKLERKYQDYGYFVGWEEDEAPMALAMEQLQLTYNIWIQQYWNRYAPQPIKTAARNIRYNVTSLKKKFDKAWKKTIWPILEPFLGVPKGGSAQKRKDASEAQKTKKTSGSSKTKQRNREFRDDVDED